MAGASVTFHHGCFHNGSAEYRRAKGPLEGVGCRDTSFKDQRYGERAGYVEYSERKSDFLAQANLRRCDCANGYAELRVLRWGPKAIGSRNQVFRSLHGRAGVQAPDFK